MTSKSLTAMAVPEACSRYIPKALAQTNNTTLTASETTVVR